MTHAADYLRPVHTDSDDAPAESSAPVRINLGAGSQPLDGWANVDIHSGELAYPLHRADASADEIRASHILEHFSHRQVPKVLAEWVRVLKPGGSLRIAVPDFRTIAAAYLKGEELNVQGYVMGGHVDEHDHHGAIFDRPMLTKLLRDAGLRSIQPWTSEQRDGAALPISLNLQGIKPRCTSDDVLERAAKTVCVMSQPRLGFLDHFRSMWGALPSLGIRYVPVTGAYWGQCLERGMKHAIELGAEWILTADYDSAYTETDVRELIALSLDHPKADAIAPIQVHRQRPTPLMTATLPGTNEVAKSIPKEFFQPELSRIDTAHFGLTLIKVKALERVAHPWFWGRPSRGGEWNHARTDDDIHFWREWAEFGKTLYLANHVTIGHIEAQIRWPDANMHARHQHPNDFWVDGKPPWVWQ